MFTSSVKGRISEFHVEVTPKIQYCAKEMHTKFAEISEITLTSAIKFRTFVLDENAANFRCFYCSNVGEISQAMRWIETKFRGMRRNFVAKFRAGRTKFRDIRTKFRFDEAIFRFAETKYRFDKTKFRFHEKKFRFHETKFRSGGAKFRLPERSFVFQEFVADYRMQL